MMFDFTAPDNSTKQEATNLLPTTTTTTISTTTYGSFAGTSDTRSGTTSRKLQEESFYSTSYTTCSASDDTSSNTSDYSSSSYGLPSPPRQQQQQQHQDDTTTSNKQGALTTLQLATIIFYSVSGGPFGVEEAIRSAGPFYTLLGFCIAPLIFSVPECLITVELASGGFQSSAAGCAWVEEAFGRHMGFLAGLLSYVAGATDNAIYPVLFLEYTLQVFPNEEMENLQSTSRIVLLTGISFVLSYITWKGLDLVGNMSIVVCAIAMSPFVLLTILGMTKIDPQLWLVVPTTTTAEKVMEDSSSSSDDLEGGFLPNIILGGVLLRPFLNNLFWNFNSFDNAGSFSEDIQDPVRVLPRAMTLGLLMVFFGYIIPLLVALGTTDVPQEEWVDGYLATVSVNTVGPWLGKVMIFAAALSNIGLFQAELSADAYMLMGMADRGYLPKFFAIRSANGTPTYSLLLGTIVIVVMGVSNLDSLIEMLNFNYSLALILEYAAFIKLRISKPDVYRPCRIPLSTLGCTIGLIPTVATLLLVIALASYTTIFVNAIIIGCGMILYCLSQQQGRQTFNTTTVSPNFVVVDCSSCDHRNGEADVPFKDSYGRACC